ncbi:MAG: aspartate-semialdehyde dehydrogenase [Thiothrix sp.]|uniref:aspartate-semialdehyde dehydrogenase n=1 Tax=Thiothrix sp. TaxID=1032 RepID=UPI0026191F26|nr:aspartate-semialdehyde dehydrogenase [Thiothrix sp.]MDD5392153.1 aspartate-semialdehyde dehydrogenase [Thiothrix sp.]
MTKTYNIAVVGATSLVGEAILDVLAKRKFPFGKVYALEYQTDGEQDVDFGNKSLDVEELAGFDFSSVQIALFAASEEIAAEYVPLAVAAGCVVIDDSTCFRYDDDVPLVVPEVNPQAIAQYTQRGIIANPGSGVTQMLIVLKPLHDVATITRINVATYQSVSGSGRAGVEELAQQAAQLLNARPVEAKVYPKQIAFNLLPHIDVFLENGYTKEEMKMVWETRKVMGLPGIQVNPTAVRVPVFFGHSEAVHIETESQLTAVEARRILGSTPGIIVMDEHVPGGYPTPVTDAVRNDAVYVGRIREDISCPAGLNLWVVADNVRRGAALNSVQIAEVLIRDYL